MRGSPDLFTGTVWIHALNQPTAPARAQVQHVTFEPGARTVWHRHPLGQVLVVTDGEGWVQVDGEAVQEVRPGDVVSILPGEKHWHGATRTRPLTFVAVQEERDGAVVEAMERVAEEDYDPRSGTRP